MNAIAERVAAGAAFLDEHDPEWWRADVERAIDLNRLDLGATGRCVLGQRCPLENPEYSPFMDYAVMLSGISGDDFMSLGDWAVDRGFDRPQSLDGERYDDLTAEWKRVITERRSAVTS